MSDPHSLQKGFYETLYVLRDVLPRMVLVGGWCPFIYTEYLWERAAPAIPTTLDIDLGVSDAGHRHYRTTVFERLRLAGFESERLYPEENQPVEFSYRDDRLQMKIEFITSFETPDDTLNRFLGRDLACNRIEAFEILLDRPLKIKLKAPPDGITVNVPRPEAFLFHKGLSFVMRPDEIKRDKDLFYIYFILKHHPEEKILLEALRRYRNNEFFDSFRQNMLDYLGDISCPGYLMLRPFLRNWMEEGRINEDILSNFAGLLTLLR